MNWEVVRWTSKPSHVRVSDGKVIFDEVLKRILGYWEQYHYVLLMRTVRGDDFVLGFKFLKEIQPYAVKLSRTHVNGVEVMAITEEEEFVETVFGKNADKKFRVEVDGTNSDMIVLLPE